jgi:hypothetical protein
MMKVKNKGWMTIIVVCSFLLTCAPLYPACEDQEIYGKDLSFNANNFAMDDKTNGSSGLFDYILDRYPLLNEIIQMILNLLYNWLSELYAGTSFG